MEAQTQSAPQAGIAERYTQATLDVDTLEQCALLMHQVTRRSMANAADLLRWAHELIVCRNQWGEVTAVHGFRLGSTSDAHSTYRLIYVLFSAVDSRCREALPLATRVALWILERERRAHQLTRVVWVNAPGCATNFGLGGPGAPHVRRLSPNMQCALPTTMLFFTSAPPASGFDRYVPPCVEKAVSDVVAQQRDRDFNRRVTPMALCA